MRCVISIRRLLAVLVEQAQLDALGVLGEEREVRPAAVPGRAERERPPGPDVSTSPDQRSREWRQLDAVRRRRRGWPVRGRARPRFPRMARGAARRRSCRRARTRPRRTRSHRALLVELDRIRVARRQPPARRQQLARTARASAGSRWRVSFERSNVATSCGSGTSLARTRRTRRTRGAGPRASRRRSACRCGRRRTETAPARRTPRP